MKRSDARGFTLVEIMIVVAIIALLAAIAIPNVLRARATASETATIGNMRALISSLEMYRSVYQAYPSPTGNWATNMAGVTPAYSPPAFPAMPSTVQGYVYTYFPATAPAQTYVMRAVPNAGQTRSIWANESGQVYHCSGTSTANAITTQLTVDQTPIVCP